MLKAPFVYVLHLPGVITQRRCIRHKITPTKQLQLLLPLLPLVTLMTVCTVCMAVRQLFFGSWAYIQDSTLKV
jgi:hypothetical protein